MAKHHHNVELAMDSFFPNGIHLLRIKPRKYILGQSKNATVEKNTKRYLI